LYYRYINPVVVSPEGFDVIETLVNPTQRKNLGEVAKNLQNISVGKIASDNPDFSKYLESSAPKFASFLREACATVTAEEYFGIDEFHDSGAQVQGRINVYITPDEIVQVHHSLVENLQQLYSTQDDPLRVILNEMGIPPAHGTSAKGPGSEVVLRLVNRFGKISGKIGLNFR
jgi:Ras GTPase-activating-like protein IQGAP2/3